MISKTSKKPRRGPAYGRGRRGQGGALRKVLLSTTIIVLPALALSGGGYLAHQHLNTEAMSANYCYERDDQERVAVFVDFSLTQDVSDSQRRDLTNTLIQTYDRLPANGMISVFTTANSVASSVVEPVFVQCKPAKSIAEQNRIGAPESSPTKLARQHKEAHTTYAGFVGDLVERSQSQSHGASSSPILEQVQGISRYDFGGPLNTFVLYTDGINNSATARFCTRRGHLPPFSQFAERPDYSFIKPDDFKGAHVNIQLVEGFRLPSQNMPFCTHQELRLFWTKLFQNNGAGSVQLTPLGYGAGQ